MKYRCLICGHIYDEEKEGVKFADLPADWKCPTCKQPKEKARRFTNGKKTTDVQQGFQGKGCA